MLSNCSLIKYIGTNAFDYNTIIVYFTVLKPGTLYLAWYSPSYRFLIGFGHSSTGMCKLCVAAVAHRYEQA